MIEGLVALFQQVMDAVGLEQYRQFHFLRPYWLLLLLPFYFVYRGLARAEDTLAPWRQAMSPQMLQHLTIQGSEGQWLTPRKLSIPIVLIGTFILAGPSWRQQSSPFLEDQSVLVIALDVSQSMNLNDLQPSRLLRAKQKTNQLMERRGDARTALIAFGGSAHVAMPLTDDREMIRHFVDVLDTSVIPVEGKNPAAVLPRAQSIFSLTRGTGTLLLLTDNATESAIASYRVFFDEEPHQLIVWAIGQEKSMFDASSGSEFNPGALADLADAGGGVLVRFSHNDDDVAKVNRAIRNNLVGVADENAPWADAGYPLLFIVAALQLVWFRRGWAMRW